MTCDLLLVIVSYRTSKYEVDTLSKCLQCLPSNIRFAVSVNEYRKGEPIDLLEADSLFFLRNKQNLGYGKAVNHLINELSNVPRFIGVLNTDLSWKAGSFDNMLEFISTHSDINLLVPQIVSLSGACEKLCKRHPTFLGMFSRRCWTFNYKPSWLRRYDLWYTMSDFDYYSIFDVPYLSGCCMIIRSSAFVEIGGFDERFFLYLEDADITRSLALTGRCIHYPFAFVTHSWGRGNYQYLSLMFVNVVSAWKYFLKWGFALW